MWPQHHIKKNSYFIFFYYSTLSTGGVQSMWGEKREMWRFHCCSRKEVSLSFSQGRLCPPRSGVPFLQEEYFVFVMLDCRTVQPCTASRWRRYVSNRHTGICFPVCCAGWFLEVIVYSVCCDTRLSCHLTLLWLCLFMYVFIYLYIYFLMNVCSIWWRPRRPSRVWRAPTSSSTV